MARLNVWTVALMQQVSKSETLTDSGKNEALWYYMPKLYRLDEEKPQATRKKRTSRWMVR